MKLRLAITLFIGFLIHCNAISQDAGTTPDALDVSLTGAATYSVPITVPPGIRGIEPKLAITFNSQAGNGLAGYGWNIGGLSTIARVGATQYHDGEIDPVDFDEKDRFALDGQRLLLKSGTYGVAGSIYQTENYSNIKIRAIGTSSYGEEYGPKYFVVHYPDGSRGFYGDTRRTKGKLEWALDKWQDTQGNFIEYTYTLDGELLRIASIEYGARDRGKAPNQIDFIYGHRNRVENSFIGGQLFSRSKTLKNIEVYAEDQLYRKYDLTHKINSIGYQTIEKIQESNGSGGEVPAILFDYGETGDGVNKLDRNITLANFDPEQRNVNTLSGDFDGDGKMDVVFFEKTAHDRLYVFNDLQNNSQYGSFGFEVQTGYFDTIVTRNALNTANKYMQEQAFTTINDNYVGGQNSKVRFKTYAMTAYGQAYVQSDKIWQAPTYRSESGCDDNGRRSTPKKYISADFNGDGLTDVIALTYPHYERICNTSPDCNPNNPSPFPTSTALEELAPPEEPDCCQCTAYHRSIAKSYFIDLDRRKTTNFSSYSGQFLRSISKSDPIFPADFNGDGKAELIHITEGNLDVYELGSDRVLRRIHVETNEHIKSSGTFLPGDYNGDGKIDFLFPTEVYSKTWLSLVSNGNSFDVLETDTGIEYRESNVLQHRFQEIFYIPQDYNGDGKTDILRHIVNTDMPGREDNYTENEVLQLFSNVASPFGHPYFTEFFWEKWDFPDRKRYGIPIFLSPEIKGSNPEYAFISNRKVASWAFEKDNRIDNRLDKITNNGVETSIDYSDVSVEPFSYGSIDTYYSDISEVYPYININNAPNFKIVSGIERRGSGIAQKQDFRYQGMVSHALGLGTMGFKQLYRSNWYGNGVTQLWNSVKYDPQLRGVPVQEWSANFFSQSPSNYISKTDYQYISLQLPNKVAVNMPETIITDDALKGVLTTQGFLYDAYYNPSKATVTKNDGSIITDYTYFNDLGSTDHNYHVGRPRNKKTTRTVQGNSFFEEEDYSYLYNKVNTVKKRGQGTEWVTETLTRDFYGNILTKTLSAPGMATRTETFSYDRSGRYLIASTNVEQLETTFLYDTPTGNLLVATDPFDRTTTYTYDAWNRPKTETDYLGKTSTTSYTNTPDGGFELAVDYDNGPDSRETYNAFGWKMVTSALSLNNKWVNTRCAYDAAGRKTRQYEPYFSTDNSGQYNSTAYDEYGRPITIILYTGEVQNMGYNGLTSTIDDGTKTVVTTLDSFGNIITRTDPGGTVDYTYYGNGSMKSANYGGQVVETFIDAWGRKVKLIDPSAGTYEYDYNLFGELTREITPKGITDYMLDGTGKLEQKTIMGDETDMVLNYTYNTDKLLTSISSTDRGNGRSYEYTYGYDTYRRPTRVTEVNPFANFERKTTYDGYGRTLRETYKGQYTIDGTATDITVRNIYDSGSGMLEEIRNDVDNTVLWRLNAHNARGQVTQTTLGNGFVQNRGYDSYGLPKSIRDIRDRGISQQNALQLDYGFNAQRGILDHRSNLDLGWSEDFGYDNLDRLTTIGGSVQKTQNYDNRGRITNNTAIGDYSYGDDKIYRLAGLDLNEKGGGYYMGRERREITYNAFKKPVEIHEKNSGRVSFGYSPLMTRSHAWYGGLDEDRESRRYHKHYSGISPMEIVQDTETGNTKVITYIGGGPYSATVVHIDQSNPPTGVSGVGYHYLHRDYLGSIMAITNSTGTVVERTQFGAWGVVDKHLRNGTETVFGQDSLLGRGYTGHEHYTDVGLIHMNGRMYDAQLGRFLSPDNYIQDPYNTQNFDRYGYVLNNPLIFNDPSGEFSWVAVVIGAVVGGVAQAARPGANFGSILKGVIIGAVSAAVGSGVSNVVAGGSFFGAATSTTGFSAGFTSGFMGGFAGAFTGSSLSTWADGGSFGDGFGNGIGDGFKGGAISGFFGGIFSGIKSVKNGGTFFGETRPVHIKSTDIVTIDGLDKIPIVEVEGDFNDWLMGETAPGPDGNTVFRLGRQNATVTYRVSENSINWDLTLRMNAIDNAVILQNIGDGMMYTGYGFTLTGVGAPVGAKLFAAGNGVSFTGSLIESAAKSDLTQGGTSIGAFAIDLGTDALIRRIPGSRLTTQILLQNKSLKIKLIEQAIINKQ